MNDITPERQSDYYNPLVHARWELIEVGKHLCSYLYNHGYQGTTHYKVKNVHNQANTSMRMEKKKERKKERKKEEKTTRQQW